MTVRTYRCQARDGVPGGKWHATYGGGTLGRAMHKTTLYLPVDLESRLRDESRRSGRSQADLIRDALSAYLATRRRDLPGFVGIADDPGLTAAESKAWVRSRWDGDRSS